MKPFTLTKIDKQTTQIEIMEYIGMWGVSARQVEREMNQITTPNILVLLNSYGGEFFDGVAIYNLFQRSKKNVEVHILGVAASAASIIALAGNKIVMGEGTMMMIHRSWIFAMGNADEVRSKANLLDKVDDSANKIYKKKSNLSAEKIKEMVDAETWLTRDECIECGFASDDEIEIEEEMAQDSVSGCMNFYNRLRNEPQNLYKELEDLKLNEKSEALELRELKATIDNFSASIQAALP